MNARKLTVGSCFSGIGGLELGLEWTGGFETKWQIEIDPYAIKVLEKHWPKVQRFGDITNIRALPKVDVICGGFPCQDISQANPNATGIAGSRSGLWRELLRTICMVRPKLSVVENVPMLLNRGMGTVLGDLAESRHDAEWGCVSSHAVGGEHRRLRLFLIAYPTSIGRASSTVFIREPEKCGQKSARERFASWFVPRRDSSGRIWAFPNTGTLRIPDGISNRIYRNSEWEWRLHGLGNAVDPRRSKRIGEMILDYESSINRGKAS